MLLPYVPRVAICFRLNALIFLHLIHNLMLYCSCTFPSFFSIFCRVACTFFSMLDNLARFTILCINVLCQYLKYRPSNSTFWNKVVCHHQFLHSTRLASCRCFALLIIVNINVIDVRVATWPSGSVYIYVLCFYVLILFRFFSVSHSYYT